MTRNSLLIALALLSSFSAVASRESAANDFRGVLPFHAEPSDQWLVAFDGGRPRLFPARVNKSIDALTVSGAISSVGQAGYVSAVVLYADGTVHSTPLHPIGELDSFGVASISTEEKHAHLAKRKQRIEELEKELSKINESVKRSSGLNEVDAIYEKIAALDREISDEERSRRRLEELR